MLSQETQDKLIQEHFTTKNGKERKDNVSKACINAIRHGKSYTVRSYGRFGSKDVTKEVLKRLTALNLDVAVMNNAPRGGKIGNHVVLTFHRSGDRKARFEFIKKFREQHRWNLYFKEAQTPTFIEARAREAVKVINTSIVEDGYHGCGVYRVGWRNGKITCTLKGGYHDSCPYGTPAQAWKEAVERIMLQHADHIVKMDGSGTEFFFRNFEDADLVTNATVSYLVPSSTGGMHLNIQPAEAQVLEPNLLQ